MPRDPEIAKTMNTRRMPNHRTESVVVERTNVRLTSTFRVRSAMCLITLMCLPLFTGCRSFRPSDGEGLFASRDLLNTDNIRGPLERAFHEEEDALTRGEKFSAEGRRQVEVARKQFEDRDYPKALKSYQKIAKKYEESSIGEEAWFRIGECYYAMQRYPDAQNAYDKLFADYPSTKHVADASRRMFAIAKIWLEVSDPASRELTKMVSDSKVLEDDRDPPRSKSGLSARYSLIPNFFDKTRPLIDTSGRARNALKSIWLNDPTGPLADDALMLTASYYLRQKNHVEADRYFEILREEYPDSPHLEEAYVLGSHVKQLSYQGPYYDGTTLVSAENLKERTLMLFPNSEDRQQVRDDLNRIYLMKAQREWKRVELWKRKGNPRAVAIQSMQVIQNYPETRYAEMARRELQNTDPALVRDLPGMSEFLASLPSAPPAGQPSENPPSEPERRIKSVGFRRYLPF